MIRRIKHFECKICGNLVQIERLCKKIELRCTNCNKEYDVQEYKDVFDEVFEEWAASIPCDRM